MKTKIKNWLEKHEMLYGVCLVALGLGGIAFGGAYLGANAAIRNTTYEISVICPDGSVTHI